MNLGMAERATMVLPHHIGYRQGYRGINWAAFTPEFSPLVEIMSMHGASESADAVAGPPDQPPVFESQKSPKNQLSPAGPFAPL